MQKEPSEAAVVARCGAATMTAVFSRLADARAHLVARHALERLEAARRPIDSHAASGPHGEEHLAHEGLNHVSLLLLRECEGRQPLEALGDSHEHLRDRFA